MLEGSTTILAFDLSALPVINASASSEDLSLSELKTVVSDRVVPELEALDGVGAVEVSGGQAIDPEKERAATEALRQTIERRGTGPRLPLIWSIMASQQGLQLQTVGDLTPDFVQLAGGLGRVAFAELTPEMLRAMPPEVLAALPGYYIAELDAGLRSELEALAAPAGGLAEPEPLPEAARLPESWIEAAQESFRGMVTVENTTDLGPLMVTFLLNPGSGGNPGSTELLADLTPETLNAMPPDVLGGLPTEYYLSLDAAFKSQLDERVQAVIAQAERREALKDEAPLLPPSWVNRASRSWGSRSRTRPPWTPAASTRSPAFCRILCRRCGRKSCCGWPRRIPAFCPTSTRRRCSCCRPRHWLPSATRIQTFGRASTTIRWRC